MRKGEVLGLTWDDVDLDAAELAIGRQLQRVRGQLLHRETKTQASDATLPLPSVCVTALKQRRVLQDRAREAVGRRSSGWGRVSMVEPRCCTRSCVRHEAPEIERGESPLRWAVVAA